MSRKDPTELTALCLLEDGGRILLQNRVKADWQGYALPGGHVEPGESFVDAVIREMREETGLQIENPRLAGVKQFPTKDGRYVVFLFRSTRWSGTLTSSEEGEMEWVEGRRLPALQAVPDLDLLLKLMRSPDLSEFQYVLQSGEWVARLQ